MNTFKKFNNVILGSIPKPIKRKLKPLYKILQKVFNHILDFYDLIAGRKDTLVPPRRIIFIGDGDYKKIGYEFFEYFKEFGHVKATDKILDVGCGIGRMSLPFTKLLSHEGEYHGFDIVKEGIEWLNSKYSKLYPNFYFTHSNIYNKLYNPFGTVKSSEYKFSFEDSKFDFAFLTSVFTHMFFEDIDHYLGEISKVLKNGGRCLITFFLINDESQNLIKKGMSSQNLIYKVDPYSFTNDLETPESAIGFMEDYIRELFIKHKLKIISPIHYGSWCGREKYKSYQDIIIAEKNIS
ncbi:MAG: class I SAM-dependent methyltransferase [Ignavibacteriaceae bacterium]